MAGNMRAMQQKAKQPFMEVSDTNCKSGGENLCRIITFSCFINRSSFASLNVLFVSTTWSKAFAIFLIATFSSVRVFVAELRARRKHNFQLAKQNGRGLDRKDKCLSDKHIHDFVCYVDADMREFPLCAGASNAGNDLKSSPMLR